MEPIKELNRGLWNLAAPGEINDDGVGRGKTWTKLMNSKKVPISSFLKTHREISKWGYGPSRQVGAPLKAGKEAATGMRNRYYYVGPVGVR